MVCLPHAAYYVQGVKMSLGTLTENYYLKDDLSFDPPGVKRRTAMKFDRILSHLNTAYALEISGSGFGACRDNHSTASRRTNGEIGLRTRHGAGGHLEGNCTCPLDDQAAVRPHHRLAAHLGPQAAAVPHHLRPHRCAQHARAFVQTTLPLARTLMVLSRFRLCYMQPGTALWPFA